MELTKRAEALQQNLNLLGVLDIVIEICKRIESLEAEPKEGAIEEEKTEVKKKKK